MGIRKSTQRAAEGAERERMWWAEAEHDKRFPESVACWEGRWEAAERGR